MALTEIQNTIVAEEVTNTLKKAFAPLDKMTRNYNSTPSQSLTFKVVSGVGTTNSGSINNYQANATGTGAPVILNLTEYSQAFVVTQEDKKSGWKLGDLFRTAATQLANKINKDILGVMPPSSAATNVGSLASWGNKTLIKQSVLVDVEGVGVILNPDLYVPIIPDSKTALDLTEGAYGYDLGIYKVASSAFPTGVSGAVFAKDGIAVGSALPPTPSNIDYVDIELEGMGGMTVRVCNWTDFATRAEYMSLDIMMGAKILDADLVKSLKTA